MISIGPWVAVVLLLYLALPWVAGALALALAVGARQGGMATPLWRWGAVALLLLALTWVGLWAAIHGPDALDRWEQARTKTAWAQLEARVRDDATAGPAAAQALEALPGGIRAYVDAQLRRQTLNSPALLHAAFAHNPHIVTDGYDPLLAAKLRKGRIDMLDVWLDLPRSPALDAELADQLALFAAHIQEFGSDELPQAATLEHLLEQRPALRGALPGRACEIVTTPSRSHCTLAGLLLQSGQRDLVLALGAASGALALTDLTPLQRAALLGPPAAAAAAARAAPNAVGTQLAGLLRVGEPEAVAAALAATPPDLTPLTQASASGTPFQQLSPLFEAAAQADGKQAGPMLNVLLDQPDGHLAELDPGLLPRWHRTDPLPPGHRALLTRLRAAGMGCDALARLLSGDHPEFQAVTGCPPPP